MNTIDPAPIATVSETTGGPYGLKMLGMIAAVPVWLAALATCVSVVADSVARYVFHAPFADLSETLPRVVAWLLIAAFAPGIPYLIWSLVARERTSGARLWATPLSIAPGALVSLVLLVISVAYAAIAAEIPVEALWQNIFTALDSFVFLLVVLIAATAALCAGGRPPLATAAAASFGLLIVVLGMQLTVSIAGLGLALLVPLVVLGCLYLFGMIGSVARVATWLIGIGLTLLLTLLSVTGVVTPTEAGAVIMLFALLVGLPLRLALARRGVVPLMLAGAAETIGVALAVAALACVFFVATLAGWTEQISSAVKSLAPYVALSVVCVAALVGSILFTPTVGASLAALGAAALQGLGFEPGFIAAEILLAALAGMTVRATAWRNGGAGAVTGKFGAGIGAMLVLGYVAAIVGVAIVPALATRLPALLQ